MIDRKKFYETIRPMFGGSVSQKQVEGMEAILAAYETKYSDLSLHSLAYILATAYHETGRVMHPICEWGLGHGLAYGGKIKMDGQAYHDTDAIFFGRGFVQLTWYENYKKVGDILKLDLLQHPELVLEMDTAIDIMFQGMKEGWFTGRKLSNYFSDKIDLLGARKIINGNDKAAMIAGYCQSFYNGLKI